MCIYNFLNIHFIPKYILNKYLGILYMFTSIYNTYYYDEYLLAKEQLKFFENKLKSVDNESCNECNKTIRKKRIELNIYCIKYTYGL